MLKKNLYTICLVFSVLFSRAQLSRSLVLTTINEENGLSDNHVTCVLKDKEGFVWVGTEDGLNQLDGSSIKIFKHDPSDLFSISNNYINAVKEDVDGNVWIATSLGLNCYDKKTKHFSRSTMAGSPYGTSEIISSIDIDGNFIWCGTDGGLIQFNRNNHKSIFYECGKEEPLINRRYCNKTNYLLLDENSICWLCTSQGLWSFDTKKNLFKKQISAENDAHYNAYFLTLLNGRDNKLWVGTWQTGLKLFDKKTGKVISYTGPGVPSSIFSIVKVEQPGHNDVLWLNGNLIAFNPSTSSFFQYQKPLLLPAYPTVKGNYVSEDNWIWIFTDDGLYVYNPNRQVFDTHVFKSAITSQDVVMNTLGKNTLIGGEGNNILMEYDSAQNVAHNYSNLLFKSRPTKKQATAALSLWKESDTKWWMGTSEGLVHIDLAANNTTWYYHKNNDSTSLPRNFINNIFIDSKRIIWIFPWREGIWQLDAESGKAKKVFDGFSIRNGIRKKLVIADAAEDEQGNLWLCDLDEGIIFYNRAKHLFSQPFNKKIGGGLHTGKINKLNGFFYTVANNFIVKWKDSSDCEVIHFPPEMEKEVYDFVADQDGNWWFTTKNGLLFFNEKNQIFKRFTTADGLYSNDLNATLYCTPADHIIIGAAEYLTSFNPSKLSGNLQGQPQLLLTKFTANSIPVKYTIGHIADLDDNDNNIDLEWALPDYNSPFHNRYYCQLQNIDSSWRFVGNKGQVQYANLAPGKYNILLKATSANGDLMNDNINIFFIIHPPFWRTIWFILLIIIFIFILIYGLFKRRLSVVRKKIELRQQMSELEMKALRAQMNPHFIFNSLNSIQECIVTKNTDSAYKYLSQFSKLVRRILENSGKETVPLKEEQELMQWYITLEQLRFTDEFKFNIKNNCSNPMIEIPSMLIQPFVENALWHGLISKKGEKNLDLIFDDDKNGIVIQIIDNGIGRKAASAAAKKTDRQSLGMSITKERLQNYSYASSIEIIDLYNEDSVPCGTKVIIHLPYN
ncbi:MAG: histidine kinase [Ginsengibacter sp.]